MYCTLNSQATKELRLDPRGCHLFSAGPEAPAGPALASRTPAPAKP
jgi:hypothetical protein